MLKVLCVDDNIDLVELLAEMLKIRNYDTRTVTSGKDCLDLLHRGEFKPDIILLDIMMSPLDGWATLRQIRNDGQMLAIPVMMLTGKYPTMAEVSEYCTLFERYLMKPFALGSLTHEINDVLESVEKREAIIQDARLKGADDDLLNEYRRLSSTSFVLRQFEQIITDGTFTKETFLGIEKRLESIKQRLNEFGVLIGI